MRSLILFTIALWFIPHLSTAQVTREEILHFKLDDFTFQNDNNKVVITSPTYNIAYSSDCKAPGLPLVRVNILIRENESFEGVFIETDDYLISSDISLAPNPPIIPTDNTYVINNIDTSSIVYNKNYYPENDIEYTGTHIIGGYKYISFLVCPFIYNTTNRSLYLKQRINIKYELSYTSTEGSRNNNSEESFINNNLLPEVKKLVANYNHISDLYRFQDEQLNKQTFSRDLSPDGYDYIIITNNNLKTAFQNLADWKTKKGIRSKILTTDYITSHYSGGSLQIKIKKAIKDYYNGTFSGLKYVLLGGDVEIVPSQMCYIECNPNDSTHYESLTPSDMYFVCFDGNFEWDANGNGVFGELNDNIDLAPEVIITRSPVSTLAEATAFVNRIISYEENPNVTDWQNSLLMGGHALSGYSIINGLCDAEIKADSFYVRYIQPYWNGERTKLFNTYQGDSAYIFNPTNLQKKLEEGFTFVDIITHGLPTLWCMRGLDDYNVDSAQVLNNSGHSIITTTACLTNAFDNNICLSEAFIRNINSGILAYLGCSREGWYYMFLSLTGPSFDYNGEFYKNLFTDPERRFGKAVMNAKNHFIPSCSTYDNSYRWIMLGLNPIGDPEMPVFIDGPRRFENLNISLSNGGLIVNTGEQDCTICVSDPSDLETGYYEVRNGSMATFSSVENGYCLCITKAGYIPFIAICRDTEYLQNEVITGNYNIVAGSVYAGSDVTTTKPQGPVLIQSGNVEIYGTNCVTIKNDFEVLEGATLKIATGN